jgi:type IV pilus assembly protein PilB
MIAASSAMPLYSRPRARLGDIVVERGYCTREAVEDAVLEASESGIQIGELLVQRGLLSPDELATAVAERFGLDRLALEDIQLDAEAAQLLPSGEARRRGIVPVELDAEGRLVVAVANPADVVALDEVSMSTDHQLRPVVVSPAELDVLLKRSLQLDEGLTEPDAEAPSEQIEQAARESADDAPTIRLVRSLISQAAERGASDIHFDPDDGGLKVRYRIDGVMTDAVRVPRRQAAAVISRIKILGELDISERRLPQDGRIGIDLEDRHVDVRVAILPLVAGEAAVLRILDSKRAPISIDALGMGADAHGRLLASLRSSHGGILVTGPTGSGKTTTLYAVMALVRSPERTLVTIEDPVEYRLDGVNQVQVSERVGLTFASGLRAIVRGDPDVVMVGEIRDRESAHIAIDAAMTGHLVLSTMHTNDAPSAPLRLLDMGVEPFVVAASINCVVAQRLARCVCTHCRRPTTISGALVGSPSETVEVYEANGCAHCGGSGYSGRVALFEVMPVSEEVRALIAARAPAHEISRLARSQGMQSIREDGYAKVLAGQTTLAELARVLG